MMMMSGMIRQILNPDKIFPGKIIRQILNPDKIIPEDEADDEWDD